MKPLDLDVLIIGAGLSGIGMACHLQQKCPQKRYAIVEQRESMGGTWDLFRFPGIRSDSDMFTLGYKFKPWLGEKDIADGASILRYIQETAAEHQIGDQIHYGHAVESASWSSADATWTVRAKVASGETKIFRCNLLLACAGYYRYQAGYTPEFPQRDTFGGRIIHPQHWPADFDGSGKRVIVIGSGATAVTLVPAIAKDAEHVVMLQRSPTYMMSRPDSSRLTRIARKILPTRTAYALSRWYNSTLSSLFYRRSRTHPEKTRRWLIDGVRSQLDENFDVEKHFSPRYDPWDQRLCLVPGGDLFQAIQAGKVSMVTDQIDRFTPQGIRLKSGEELTADVIVTATGLEMQLLGGIQLDADGQPIDFSQTFTYKGMMYSDVPNLVTTFGYVNASWTLRADLIADFVCRLIAHMDQRQMRRCTPRLSESEKTMTPRPFIEGFSAGYVQRALKRMPKQGDREPWLNTQDYRRELKMIGRCPIEDGSLIFDHPVATQVNAAPNAN